MNLEMSLLMYCIYADYFKLFSRIPPRNVVSFTSELGWPSIRMLSIVLEKQFGVNNNKSSLWTLEGSGFVKNENCLCDGAVWNSHDFLNMSLSAIPLSKLKSMAMIHLKFQRFKLGFWDTKICGKGSSAIWMRLFKVFERETASHIWPYTPNILL